MVTKTVREQAGKTPPVLSSEQVWRAVARASFAVLSHVTPGGDPRSSGVMYKTTGRRLVVAVAPGSWKARHVAADGRVAVTILVRRGGILSLVAPIPPGHHQLPRNGGRAPGRIAPGPLDAGRTGVPHPRRAARRGVHHRDHPDRGVPHLRARRLVAGDAQPGRGPGTGAGHA